MKYEATKERILRTMKNLMLEKFPELASPLEERTVPSLSNSGYGSSLDDYYRITTLYKDEDGETWFKHFDDRDHYQDSKWEVNDGLEILYDTFGVELFQDFVKEYFGLDLTEKGNKAHDWLFR